MVVVYRVDLSLAVTSRSLLLGDKWVIVKLIQLFSL